MRDCLVTSPAAATTTVPRTTDTATPGQHNTVRESSPKSPICESSPKSANSGLASKSPVCKLKVGNSHPENVENYMQNEEEEKGHLSNDSGELEPMEDTENSAYLGCEDPRVPLIETSKETASLKETLEESEAPLSATSKDGALLTEAAEQNEAPLSEASKLRVLLTENLEQIETRLSETYEGLSESHRATLLNVTRSNGGSPTQTTPELSAARDGGQKEREIRDSDNEVETEVNNAGNSSKGDVFSLVSDAVDVVTGEGDIMDTGSCSEEEDAVDVVTGEGDGMDTGACSGEEDAVDIVTGEGDRMGTGACSEEEDAVDVVTGEGDRMDTGACSEEEEEKISQVNTTSPTCLLETVQSQPALSETMETQEGDGIPMSECGSIGASPDTPTSVEVETLGVSMDQNVKRNDKEALKSNKYKKYAHVQNKLNRSPSPKWRVQLKSYSPARTKSCEMKPKSQNRVSHTKTGDGEKDSSGTTAVSAVKTKRKAKGKNSGEKSVRWSDLTLPDCVQQYFNRSCTEIIPGAQSQDKVHLKFDPSPNSKRRSKPACKNAERKERKNTSKMKNKGPRAVKVAKDGDNSCKEEKVSSISAKEFIPAQAQHSNTPENNVPLGKRQMAAPRGTSRETKRRKMATLGSSKPETERCSFRLENRAVCIDDEQIKSTGAAVKSTGEKTKKKQFHCDMCERKFMSEAWYRNHLNVSTTLVISKNIRKGEGLNVQCVPLVKDTKSRGENKLMNIGIIAVFDSDIMKSTHCIRVIELNSLSGKAPRGPV